MKRILLALACAFIAVPTAPALACGGFFCSTSPINQSREVVVYGYEPDGTLTMAVQVNYSGVEARDYYNCLTRGDGSSCGEPSGYDPVGLTAAIEREITAPRRQAQALLRRHPYTTRLSTTIRAEDMSVDPVFELDADLPDVPQQRQATVWTRCAPEYYASGAPQDLERNGRLVSLREGEIFGEEEACQRIGGVATTGAKGCSAAANSDASTFLILTALGFGMMALFRRRR